MSGNLDESDIDMFFDEPMSSERNKYGDIVDALVPQDCRRTASWNSVVNAWLAYKNDVEVTAQRRSHVYSIKTFRENLVYSLLSLEDEILSAVRTTDHHYISELTTFVGEGKNKRRYRKNCKICYKAMREGAKRNARSCNKVKLCCRHGEARSSRQCIVAKQYSPTQSGRHGSYRVKPTPDLAHKGITTRNTTYVVNQSNQQRTNSSSSRCETKRKQRWHQ
ncbi:hypothetical protein J6590_096516 [Homalodisca vitripennis]|nr:hypothetical protein J6590_096516 [Homalodisca vitripennis]